MELGGLAWILGALAIIFSTAAVVTSSVRAAVVLSWMSGLMVGSIFLYLGVEVLGVIQWIVSTLVGMTFFLFSLLYGDTRNETRTLRWIGGLAVTLGLGVVIALIVGFDQLGQDATFAKFSGIDGLGRTLVQSRLLDLEILGVTLVLLIFCGSLFAIPRDDS